MAYKTIPMIDGSIFEAVTGYARKLNLKPNHLYGPKNSNYWRWQGDAGSILLTVTWGNITLLVFDKPTANKRQEMMPAGFRIEFRKGIPVRCKADDVYGGSPEMLEFLSILLEKRHEEN